MRKPRDQKKWLQILHKRLEELPDEYKKEIKEQKSEKNGEKWLYLNDRSKKIHTTNFTIRKWKENIRSFGKVLGITKLLPQKTEVIYWKTGHSSGGTRDIR